MEPENRTMQRKQSRGTERNKLLDPAIPETHTPGIFTYNLGFYCCDVCVVTNNALTK